MAKKPKRRRRWLVVLTIFVGVLIVAEGLISRAIANKLCATVAKKIDAELNLGALIYVPPYQAIVFGLELVHDDRSILKIDRVNLRLAELPRRGRPLVIESAILRRPVIGVVTAAG